MWCLLGVAFVGCTGQQTADLPEIELSPRIRPAVAWVGDGAFVFGGTTPERPDPGTYEEVFLADGAVVASGSARGPAIPPPPFDGRLNHAEAAVVDGDVVLRASEPPRTLLVLEVDTGEWRLVDEPAATTRSWCVEQGSLVTVASDRRLSLLDLADPGEATVRTAEAPLSLAAGPPAPVVTCTGDGVVVTQVSGDLAATTYDPAPDQWGPVSAPDAGTSTFVDTSFWTGDEVVLVDGGNADRSALALDPTTGAWRSLPPPPVALGGGVWGEGAAAVWDGEALMAYDPG